MLQLPTSELDPVQFFCSKAHILAGWRLETRLDNGFLNECFFIATSHGPRREHNPSIAGKAGLQRRSIATEVTQFLLAYSLLRVCVYRVVA
jgi:hypothetical protein